MAVEDGAVLGYLLGSTSQRYARSIGNAQSFDYIKGVLGLYEKLRKARTTVNTKGAVANREMYHLPDGAAQQRRDAELKDFDYVAGCSDMKWADSRYQLDMLGFDAVEDARRAFGTWCGEVPKL